MTSTPAPLPAKVRITARTDDLAETIGFAPPVPYAELVWLPRVGPSTYLMWRHLCRRLHQHPGGCTVVVDDLADAIGLGRARSATSPVWRTLARLERFDVAHATPDGYAVRRRLPRLTARQLAHLPPSVRHAHHVLLGTDQCCTDQCCTG